MGGVNRSVLEWEVCVLEWEVCVLEWEVCVLEWEVCVLEWEVCVLEWEVCVLEWEVCVLEWEGGAVGWSGLGVWLISVNCPLFAGIKKAARRLLFLVSEFSDQNVKNTLLSLDKLSDCASRDFARTLPSNLALSLLPLSPPVTVNIGTGSPSASIPRSFA